MTSHLSLIHIFASSAPAIELPEAVDAKSIEKRVKIGVAYDEAVSYTHLSTMYDS